MAILCLETQEKPMDPQTQVCPNICCPARGKSGKGNIVVHSRKEARYKCTACDKTFAATTGTPFYRLHHSLDLVTIVVTLIALGCPVQAIVVAFELDERTIMDWQTRAGKHCQKVHEHLVEQPRDLGHVQADEIRVKAQGTALWLATAIMVRTRLWLGAAVSPRRDEALLQALFRHVRACALARPLLVVTDGLSFYFQVIRDAFRSGLPARGRGRPTLIHWPDLCIGQVAKQYQGRRVAGILRRVLQGTPRQVASLIQASGGGKDLNTAFIERLNATFRSRLASLARRSRALLRKSETLTPLVYLMGSVYNFCSEHQSLRLKLWVGSHGFRWVQRTPAMATGITDHCWTVKELLLYRLPIPAWTPPHRGRRSAEEKALMVRWA
jgi:transposase-like protein